MSKIKINKMDAARRQIAAAIRMTIADEDPVAIHSVISAANRVVRDLCAKRGDLESHLRFTDWIADGHEKQFWSAAIQLVRSIMDPLTGRSVRIFECNDCGQRTWDN